MTATNHALTGALIGLSVTNPFLALPLAFVSHFVLDAIPHFGHLSHNGDEKKRRFFHVSLLADALLLAIVITSLYMAGAGWLVLACVFLAGCPDFYQTYYYLFNSDFRQTGEFKNPGRYARFTKKIQREETLKGLFIEIPLAIVLVWLISRLL